MAYSIKHPTISLQTKADWHPPANPPTIIHGGPAILRRILLDSDAGSCPLSYVTMTMSKYQGFISYALFLSVWFQAINSGKCLRIVSSTESQLLNQHSLKLKSLCLVQKTSPYLFFQYN